MKCYVCNHEAERAAFTMLAADSVYASGRVSEVLKAVPVQEGEKPRAVEFRQCPHCGAVHTMVDEELQAAAPAETDEGENP